MSKQNVSITLASRQEDQGLSETTRQTHTGTLYEKNDGHYLIYNEEAGSTSIRFDMDEIRLFRRGEVESWQTFRLGELTGGMVTLGVNPMNLAIMTSYFEVNSGPEGGRIELHYQLWTGATSDPDADLQEVSLGQFELVLEWVVTPAA